MTQTFGKRDQALVVGISQAGLPVSTEHPGQHSTAKQYHHDRDKDQSAYRSVPQRDSKSTFFRTVADAGQATGTFRRKHPGLVLYIDQLGTGTAAGPAIDARLLVAADLERAEHTEQAEQCAIGAEVSTPEIPVDNRQQGQHAYDKHAGGRHPGKEMQHLDIGNRPVRCSEIRLERTGRHVNQDQFDEKQQKRVLDELKDKIKPPPDTKIPAEQFIPKLPGHFREGPHRADKGAERFLCQKRHDQKSEKKHQRRRMNRVEMPGEQPGLETHQRTDRQKAFNTRRARIISGHSLRLEMTHEQSELDTEEHAPAEEKPLDQLSPVGWLFTTEDIFHKCRGYTYLNGKEMTLVKRVSDRSCFWEVSMIWP